MNSPSDEASRGRVPGMAALSERDASRDRETLLEQYKLAVEMAARSSTKRQEANNFYVGLVSTFAALYSVLDKLPSLTQTKLRESLPIFGVIWCVMWWLTIRSYRRINKAKWSAIYELERDLPWQPFRSEGEYLAGRKELSEVESRGSFALSKFELFMPLLVGLGFLLLAVHLLLN